MSALDIGATISRRAPAGACCCAACCAAFPERRALRTPPAEEIFARGADHRRRCAKCGRRWRRGDWFCRHCNEERETHV
jgi:hypothetical protein